MQTGTTFDPQDADIVASLTPEGAEPGTPAGAGIDATDDDGSNPTQAAAPASAPAAPAAPAPAPVAEAPAPAATAPAPTEAAAPAADPNAQAPAPAPAEDEHKGNLRNALRAARHDAKRKEDRIKELESQLQQAREQQGNAAADPADDEDPLTMSAERLAEIERDFPLQAKTIKHLRELHSRVAAPAASAPAPATDWTPPVAPPAVQEVIDQVPQLLAWQLSQADQPKFELATRYDDVLRADPAWQAKPVAERFAEAARRAASHFNAPAAKTAAARAEEAIAATPAQPALGVSDFRGGSTAQPPQLDMSRMSDDEIMRSLPVQD